MICDWCLWPFAAVLFVENVRERLCEECRALVVRYRIANVRL